MMMMVAACGLFLLVVARYRVQQTALMAQQQANALAQKRSRR